ncbi:glycosyltransferase family 2 protein [Rhizobium sp. AG855]|uniref:glycosyltransferase family 2 protein n=1 Tax=Rhizobium sp. AG855 TaxID=2183898 RepID=UPI000FF82F22|nr:glycosyltransferase family 2 protein [Rhizobium sp. AG855]RKE79228.1 glycosyl transferase family 2 [Rhizobium sp. AG855]
MTDFLNRKQALEVTIVVCCYNAERTITRTLESLRQQTYPVQEILVIDDASSDRSYELVRDYAATFRSVRVLRNSRNRGPAFCRQLGLEEAHSECILFFDADDIAKPRLLERQARILESDPSLLGVGCYAHYFESEADVPKSLGLLKVGPTNRAAALKQFQQNKLVFMTVVTLIWRRDALAVGGYRQDLLPNSKGLRYEDYAEDLDLWCRMADLGASGRHFITIPEPLFFYRKPAGSLSTRNVAVMQLKMRWIKDCMIRRRKGLGERRLAEFLASRTLFQRLSDRRSDLAAAFYKRAGFAHASRRYLRMGVLLGLVAVTSPKLILQKLKTQSVQS